MKCSCGKEIDSGGDSYRCSACKSQARKEYFPFLESTQPNDEVLREILERVKPLNPCCSSCEEDKSAGFGDDIDGCCCRHITVDEAIPAIRSAIAKELEGMKIKGYRYDKGSSSHNFQLGYNQAITDAQERIRRGE